MAMTYTTLVAAKTVAGSIKSWTNDTTLDPDTILTDAQSLIYGQLRAREMRASATVTLGQGAFVAPMPANFLESITRLYDTSYNSYLRFLPEENLLSRRVYSSGVLISSIPSAYTIINEQFEFDCLASSARSYLIAFYQSPTPLAAGNQTNFLTNRYPLILRTACVAMAFDWRHDDANYQRVAARLTSLIGAANIEADLSRQAEAMEVRVIDG